MPVFSHCSEVTLYSILERIDYECHWLKSLITYYYFQSKGQRFSSADQEMSDLAFLFYLNFLLFVSDSC